MNQRHKSQEWQVGARHFLKCWNSETDSCARFVGTTQSQSAEYKLLAFDD